MFFSFFHFPYEYTQYNRYRDEITEVEICNLYMRDKQPNKNKAHDALNVNSYSRAALIPITYCDYTKKWVNRDRKS
ncbi:hypothetical protein TetV_004 [Tetraselmis virus 1]|uniref:Uncharacterized protein n=1 Tax=Tetraselmis virus 1 TaxID=2060617 RepID=A0A2P0VMH5_9VIRU|nr:hypothetical protein QJ968_gp004 [Tetraselmis virus 1]AUF82096.1 hypothetical protein TetV_004 [Tetraselmis virus 1]